MERLKVVFKNPEFVIKDESELTESEKQIPELITGKIVGHYQRIGQDNKGKLVNASETVFLLQTPERVDFYHVTGDMLVSMEVI